MWRDASCVSSVREFLIFFQMLGSMVETQPSMTEWMPQVRSYLSIHDMEKSCYLLPPILDAFQHAEILVLSSELKKLQRWNIAHVNHSCLWYSITEWHATQGRWKWKRVKSSCCTLLKTDLSCDFRCLSPNDGWEPKVFMGVKVQGELPLGLGEREQRDLSMLFFCLRREEQLKSGFWSPCRPEETMF